MKKLVSVIMVVALIISAATGSSEGLLPGFTSLLGVEMPSLSAVILRLADEESIDSDGNHVVTFYGVTEMEFNQFSEYLDTFGCIMTDCSVTGSGSAMHAVIAKQGATFSFSYDTADGTCVLVYPNGTNEEDVKQKIIEIIEAKWQVGNYVTFASYPQTKAGNDETPIEWIVLARDGDKALVISRYALEAAPYNTEFTKVTWETCSLRTWLNNDFYNKAFSAEEKESIVLSKVTADKNPEYSTNPGNDTNDNVFLLSITEENKYFKDDASRMCAPTDYAVKKGAYTISQYKADGRASCWWWLRSPGSYGDLAAVVDHGGSVYGSGCYVNLSLFCVRPCVWVRIF